MSFEKVTHVSLPWDRTNADPKKNYGIHGLEIRYLLKGEKGATQFVIYIPVFLNHITPNYEPVRIKGWDVGYHALTPQYEGHALMSKDNCPYAKPCYYDGSSLRADAWCKEIFSMRGADHEKEIWRRLEAEYIDMFGEQNNKPGELNG